MISSSDRLQPPLIDPYCSITADDLALEPPDPFWEPRTDWIARYGPVEPASTIGPRRHAEFHDFNGLLPSYEVYHGDALNVLDLLGRGIVVNTVVTSVPYFRLRLYGDRNEELGWGSLDQYLSSLCDVFDAVPLARRGSVWVNIGDTRDKRGNLIGVPERFVVAMQDRGWFLADRVCWAKIVARIDGTYEGNCMPEPAPSRLNGNGHESLYRFVRGVDHRLGGVKKIQDAWTDTHSIAIPRQGVLSEPSATPYLPEALMTVASSIEGRVLPNVWRIPMGQTHEAHFAVFPAALSERPIAMTTPLSVCTLCGRPRERLVKKIAYDDGKPPRRTGKYRSADVMGTKEAVARSGRQDTGRIYVPRKPVTTGWSTCLCGWNWKPGTVLDPFAGTSSVGYSALLMGRDYIGIDLYQDYCQISSERCRSAIDLLREKGLVPSLLQR